MTPQEATAALQGLLASDLDDVARDNATRLLASLLTAGR